MTLPPSIAFYIGSHGFGHAARQQAVINTLAAQSVKIYVRTAAPPKFFGAPGVIYHRQHYDIGLIQPDSLSVDVDATFAWYSKFLQKQPALVQEEATFIREQGIDLIVSDMPPVAIEIAAAAGIPSVALTHFTWDWVYDYYTEANPQYRPIVQAIRESYGKATLALQMPFAHAFEMFERVEQVPLVVNAITRTREQTRADFQVPQNDRVALISMGGMAWADTDLSALRALSGWTIWVMPGAWEQVKDLPNFRLIPQEYPGYHNLIAAADVLVGKAGWSTVAECIAHQTPMIYTIRDDYRENELLDSALCNYANSLFVKKNEFQRGDWAARLDWIVERDYAWPPIASNGAEAAARRLLALIAAK